MKRVPRGLTPRAAASGRKTSSTRPRLRTSLGYAVIATITLAVFVGVGTSSLALGRNNARSVDPAADSAANGRVQIAAGAETRSGTEEPPIQPDAAVTRATPLDSNAASAELLANPVYDPSLLPFPAGPPVDIPTTERRAEPPADANTSNIDRWLEMAGWPPYLRDEAKRVSWCESRWHPDSINGNARGLFQIWQDMRPRAWGWFWYFGYPPSSWSDPIKNAEIALFVYNLDLMRGLHPWAQWECKP